MDRFLSKYQSTLKEHSYIDSSLLLNLINGTALENLSLLHLSNSRDASDGGMAWPLFKQGRDGYLTATNAQLGCCHARGEGGRQNDPASARRSAVRPSASPVGA